MNLRAAIASVVALVVAGVCVALGFWQLDRLKSRRAANAVVAARMAEPPVDVRELSDDGLSRRGRRVSIEGEYDYSREIIIANRSRDGSPGVNILTPVRIADSDSAVLVNRGWVYSPDGSSADLERWREGDHISATGFVAEFVAEPDVPRQQPPDRRVVLHPEFRPLAERVEYPIAGYYVVLAPPPGDPPRDTPVRVPPPPLDEGMHRSYAIQWFSFAAIAILGTGFVLFGNRTPARIAPELSSREQRG
jgi:surfeit locus 1 family protein